MIATDSAWDSDRITSNGRVTTNSQLDRTMKEAAGSVRPNSVSQCVCVCARAEELEIEGRPVLLTHKLESLEIFTN